MSRAQLPPKSEPLIDDNQVATLVWQSFFDSIASGDAGTTFTPTFTGLTEVGTATKTGVYYRLSAKLVYFALTITPATNTSSVLGTTYCDTFPLTFKNNSSSMSISGFTASPAGIEQSTNRIYTATWTNITNPITITGFAEAA